MPAWRRAYARSSDNSFSIALKPPSPLQFGAEFDAIGTRRCILREAGEEVTRHRCVHERIRQVSAPQTDGVWPVVHVPVQAAVYVVIGRLTQLVVRLAEPTAVMQVLRIERPVPCRCRYQITQAQVGGPLRRVWQLIAVGRSKGG